VRGDVSQQLGSQHLQLAVPPDLRGRHQTQMVEELLLLRQLPIHEGFVVRKHRAVQRQQKQLQ
jgi:hypothetical protein